MRTAVPSALVLLALAAPAIAHGGAYVNPPSGGGPQAAPGFGSPTDGGAATRWESWWADGREDLLRIAERVDATRVVVATPRDGERAAPVGPEVTRATRAAQVRDDVLGHLMWALGDGDFDVRSSAAIALGKLGDDRVAAALERCAVRDERDEVRRAAILALGVLGRPKELPFLCGLVKDRRLPMEERSSAVLAVGLVGGDDAAQFLSFLVDKDTTRPDASVLAEAQFLGTIYAALGMTGSVEALRTLWRAADGDVSDPALRAQAVLGLGRIRDRDSSARFIQLLGPNTDVQLRRSAVVALGRVVTCDDAPAIRALSTLLCTERDLGTRHFAVRALAEVRTPAVRSLLRGQFESAAEADRPHLALALGVQRDVMALAPIREALKSVREEGARAAYSLALGLIGEVDGVASLESQIGPGTTPGTYRGFAALALAILPSPASAELLWKRLPAEHDARVWGDYAVALGLLGDPRIHGFLTQALKSGDGNFDKCRAASCLGVLRRADAVPELVAVLRDPRADGIVRALCAVALGQIGDVSVVPRLTRVSSGCGATLATPAVAEALSIL